MTLDLFGDLALGPAREPLGAEAALLRGFALPFADRLLAGVAAVVAVAPFRNLVTPGGHTMSVAMTNCGELGWTSDRHGYRYSEVDPGSGAPWPAMPAAFRELAGAGASAAGFADFAPDACLINRYLPGARMTLHQDRDEKRGAAPIVSVSLGIPAVFLFGGSKRSDRARRYPVFHGDVVVWGGVDRWRFHGVLPVAGASHPLVGEQRLNLTFRVTGRHDHVPPDDRWRT